MLEHLLLLQGVELGRKKPRRDKRKKTISQTNPQKKKTEEKFCASPYSLAQDYSPEQLSGVVPARC
jgi:hypothetical protein